MPDRIAGLRENLTLALQGFRGNFRSQLRESSHEVRGNCRKSPPYGRKPPGTWLARKEVEPIFG